MDIGYVSDIFAQLLAKLLSEQISHYIQQATILFQDYAILVRTHNKISFVTQF